VGANRDYNDECDKTKGSAEGYAPAIAGGSWWTIEVVLIEAFVDRVDKPGGATGALKEIPQCLPGFHRVRLGL
jgi:hypothetical protein